MDEALFDAFDEAPAPEPPPKRPKIITSSTPASAFSHLQHEAIASLSMRNLSDDDRSRIEELLRESMVSRRATSADASAMDATNGTVHYFQSYCADYAGASSAEAAVAASPYLQYDRLMMTPLPLPRIGGSGGAAIDNGGGRGGKGESRHGGRGGRGGRPSIGFNGRYFDEAPSAATPGVLSKELRAVLGMREGEPPPYLQRMQQLGYPPGYMRDPDAEQLEEAPLKLFDPQEEAGPANGQQQQQQQRLEPMVDFPGLNVPPPPGSDLQAWGWTPRRY